MINIWAVKIDRTVCAYNNMNLIIRLSTLLPGVTEKKVASEILHRELRLNLSYVHYIYNCRHLS